MGKKKKKNHCSLQLHSTSTKYPFLNKCRKGWEKGPGVVGLDANTLHAPTTQYVFKSDLIFLLLLNKTISWNNKIL